MKPVTNAQREGYLTHKGIDLATADLAGLSVMLLPSVPVDKTIITIEHEYHDEPYVINEVSLQCVVDMCKVTNAPVKWNTEAFNMANHKSRGHLVSRNRVRVGPSCYVDKSVTYERITSNIMNPMKYITSLGINWDDFTRTGFTVDNTNGYYTIVAEVQSTRKNRVQVRIGITEAIQAIEMLKHFKTNKVIRRRGLLNKYKKVEVRTITDAEGLQLQRLCAGDYMLGALGTYNRIDSDNCVVG